MKTKMPFILALVLFDKDSCDCCLPGSILFVFIVAQFDEINVNGIFASKDLEDHTDHTVILLRI